MAFLCKCKPRPGTLSMQKCVGFGVPKGPLLGKLKNGETVTLDDGKIVRPEDVCEPDDPGPIFFGKAKSRILIRSQVKEWIKRFFFIYLF